MKKKWPACLDAIVIMDNHTAHTCIATSNWLDAEGIETIKMPSCSSPLNSIERVWATLKRYWMTFLSENCELTEDSLEASLSGVVDKNIQDKCGSYWRSNLMDCLRVIEGQVV